MKIFCVTGAPGSDLDMVANTLASAGIQPALPSQQDDSISMRSWHEHVLSAACDDELPTRPVEDIGKFWEQLASSLFVANLKAPMWLWADSRSTWLMDYWRKYDPNVHFVLVYTPPRRALASALAAREIAGPSLTSLLETWATYNRELLRFHKKLPKKSILVNAEECASNPAGLIQACSTRWKLKLNAEGIAPQPAFSPKPLATYLAEQSLVIQPELKQLQDEMDAAVHPLADEQSQQQTFDVLDAIQDYSVLRDMAAQARALSEQQDGLLARLEDLQRAADSGSQLQGELEASRKRVHDATAENEQILLQMHQLQEELERWFLESKKLGDENAALKNELATAKGAGSGLAPKDAQDLNAKIAAANSELHATRQQLTKLEESGTAQGARLQQLQTALDQASRDLATKKSELEARGKEVSTLRTERDAATRSAKEAQQESELILVQLHQVQEELENYFLQHKAAAQRNAEHEKRWLRMLQRHPDYCDFRAIEVSAYDPAAQRASWTLLDLDAAGRSFQQLAFDTVIENGVARFGLARGERALALLPLEELTTSEWTLVEALAKLVATQLTPPAGQSNAGLGPLDGQASQALLHAVEQLQAEMASFPPVLRYDSVGLKREQVNPDYEHLWLRVQNLTLGEQRVSEFEFRLSCANVRPGKFGLYPKLEFPSGTGAAPFENWYIESYDDFGEKLELRFALPEAMDLAVWNELSERDHAFMNALIATLPSMLSRLEADGLAPARGWSDWTGLATNVQRIHGLRTAAATPIPVVVEQPRLTIVPTRQAKTKSAPAKAKPSAKTTKAK